MTKNWGGYQIKVEDNFLSLTLYAPRDGAGRMTSAADLMAILEPKDALKFRDDIVMACTGISELQQVSAAIAGKTETLVNSKVARKPEADRTPGRMQRRQVAGRFGDDVARQLRVMAVEEDTTQQALLTEAINDLFRKRGKRSLSSKLLVGGA